MSRFLSSAALTLILLIAPDAGADTAYVTDILRLGIHRAADTSDRAFASLISGTPLEVLESSVNYARVRTPDGQEGWVKAAYLVRDKPAQLRVAEVETELDTLRGQLLAADAARAEAEAQALRLNQELNSDEHSVTSMGEKLARLERQNAEYQARFDRYRASLPLRWVVAALLVTLTAGFASGWWWLDARIRRRHGGYRIY